jgi:xanthine dehydrogenase YagR molybdenum-binding subunit
MSQPLVGKPLDRVDGPAKVMGQVRYTADNAVSDMLHAVVVPATIASGRISSIDDARARVAAGVVAVVTHRNAPHVDARKTSPNDSLLFLLQDDIVQFDRQPVAVVIARTFEQATHAAGMVRVNYDALLPVLDVNAAPAFVPQQIFDEPATHQRGTPQAAFDGAPLRVRQTYRTPTEHHNPMETHATIARWDGDRLTLYDATQWAFGVQHRIAAVFGIDPSNVRVVAPFVGGAFGCKGQMWSHVGLAAMAAKVVGRAVRLVVTRPQMFGWVGHRPQTVQIVSLAADRSGRLQSVMHEVRSETSVSDEFVEPCAVFSRDLYAVPNYAMSHELRRLNISKPTYQRGPGESTGSFAVESAMDELAYALNLDPLELRLRNYSENNPDSGKPYTSKNLRECYTRAAGRFNWAGTKSGTAVDAPRP